MRLFRNHRALESERLTFAILLSLALHLWLLFFVRFVQPSWQNFASGALPLNVILEKAHTEAVKPSEVLQASRDSKGKANIGVQDENSFPQKTVAAVVLTPVDQHRKKIPKVITRKKILVIEKPAREKMDENIPDLLVTKKPDQENQDKPFAPAPSVESAVTKAAPPIEDLVSVEPVHGEKQEKIVIAETVQEKSTDTKPGGSIEKPEPVKAEEPKPVEVEKPEPEKIKEPEPTRIEEFKPARVIEPEPARIEETKPVKTEEPQPIKAEEPRPVRPEIAAEPEARTPEAGKPGMLRAEPPGYKAPGLAELSIEAARRLSKQDDRKITFGERRKAIGFGAQEFRYTAYMEGVRLKLERIGAFNYPAEAAMNRLSGTLSVKISIRADGSLEDFSIARPSVHEVLNAGAEKIVRMSAPFAPLPENIKRDADILDITINWAFSGSRQSLH